MSSWKPSHDTRANQRAHLAHSFIAASMSPTGLGGHDAEVDRLSLCRGNAAAPHVAASPDILPLPAGPVRGALRNRSQLRTDQPDTVDVVAGVSAARRNGVGEYGERANRRSGGAVNAHQRRDGSRAKAGAVKRKLSSHVHTVAAQPYSVISNRIGDFR